MKLVRNWKRLCARSLSMWLGAYLPLVWLLVPEVLWSVADIQLSPVLVWVIAFALASIFPVARLIDQGIGDG